MLNRYLLGQAETVDTEWSLKICLMITLSWEQACYLNSLGSSGGGKKKNFLSLLSLKSNQPKKKKSSQPKLTLVPKRHILGWQILLPCSSHTVVSEASLSFPSRILFDLGLFSTGIFNK